MADTETLPEVYTIPPQRHKEHKIYLYLPHIVFGDKVVIEQNLERFNSVTVTFKPETRTVILNFYKSASAGNHLFSFAQAKITKRKRISVRQLQRLFNNPFEDGQEFTLAWQSEQVALLTPVETLFPRKEEK